MAITRRTLTSTVADEILSMIVDDKMGVGDALPPSGELARRFDVSVVVVREAIATLAGRGIIDRRQGREPIVARPGADVVDSILRVRMRLDDIGLGEFQQCRAALEGQAAALAATSGDEQTRADALRPCLARLAAAKTPKEVRLADLDFHVAIASLAGNRALLLFVEALHTVSDELLEALYEKLLVAGETIGEVTFRSHKPVADAIIAGDSAKSVAAMAHHFTRSLPDVNYGMLDEFACLLPLRD